MRCLLIAASTAAMPVAAASSADLNIATTIASLGLVVALILFLAWLLRRMRFPGLNGAQGGMKIVSQVPLGQKERLIVLQVNNEQLLIGVTSHQVSLIKKLDEPLQPNEKKTDFASQLGQLMKKNEKS